MPIEAFKFSSLTRSSSCFAHRVLTPFPKAEKRHARIQFMDNYKLTHVRNEALLRDLATLVAKDRATTALLLAHVAEVDFRKLYLRRACSSMHVYCMRELHLSEHEAYLRIQAARAARRFPILFTAVAEGRLHLSAVAALSQHLTRANVGELVEAATHKSKAEVLELLAV